MTAKPLNQFSGMPQMSAAFGGWTVSLTFKVITQSVVDGFVQNSSRVITVKGTWQPLNPEEIELKPEGQRSWEWIDLHVVGSSPALTTNDRVERDGVTYKVMTVKDYRLNNYVEYHLIKDYQT